MSDTPRWMKFNLRALVLTVGCLCFLSRPIHRAGKYLQVEHPPSTAANQLQIGVTYTMWLPDDVARFRCVIVHQHGAGRTAAEKGTTAAYDLHWHALANKCDCAVLGFLISRPDRCNRRFPRRIRTLVRSPAWLG